MKTRILIIGTGPYGVSIANELFGRDINFVIVGKLFELWQEHTLDTMAIRSDWHTSEIYDPQNRYDFRAFLKNNYTDYKAILKERIPIDIFRHYLRFVQENLPYNVENSYVSQLEEKDGYFEALLENGEKILAEKVIIATGIGAHIHLPKSIKDLPKRNMIHTWNTNECKDWQNQDILVLGNGQSAGETIVQLKEKNNITWVRRSKPIFYSEPLNLPVFIFKFVLHVSPYFYFLPRKIKAAFGKKFVIATITPDLRNEIMGKDVPKYFCEAKELELVEQEGKIYSKKLKKGYDKVIAATGYRYHIYHLKYLSQSLKRRIQHNHGIPKLDFDFLSSVPNLYFVGGIAEPTYGPAQRFIMGSSHAAIRMGKVMNR